MSESMPPRLTPRLGAEYRHHYVDDELTVAPVIYDYEAAEDDHGGAPLVADLTRAAIGGIMHDSNGAD